MESVFVVTYHGRENQVVTESEEFTTYELAEVRTREGHPQGFYMIYYCKIEKRVKFKPQEPILT